MNETTSKNVPFASAFIQLGAVSILISLGMSLYCFLQVRPKVAAVNSALRSTVEDLDAATEILAGKSLVLAHAVGVLRAGAEMATATPDLMDHLRGLLGEGAKASTHTAKAADKTQKGIAGAVLPKDEVKNTSIDLSGAAQEMRGLRAVIKKADASANQLATEGAALAAALSQESENLTGANGIAPRMREHLKAVGNAIDYAGLPTQATLLGQGISGIYLIFGLMSVLFGFYLKQKSL